MTTRLPKRGKSSGAGGGASGASGGASGDGGGRGPHPLARAIEQLYTAGATPRLMIDARRADVVVPDFVRAKWAEKLVIDLDASYPLDLRYDVAGVHVSLAFSGIVSRCTFSWPSIYRIVDRADGRGIMVPAHEPAAELAPELAYESAEPRPVTEISARVPPKAADTVVSGPRSQATPAEIVSQKPSLSAVPPAASPAPAASPSPEAAKAESASDAEAKARRAKFRVIEGG